MGIEDPGASVYKLVFDERSKLDGLTVRVRSLSLDELATVQKYMSVLDGDPADETTLAKIGKLADVFADALIEWNLQAPVPTTRLGVKSQRLAVVADVLRAWRDVAIATLSPTQDGQRPSVRDALPAPAAPADPEAERRTVEADLLQLPVSPLTAPTDDE